MREAGKTNAEYTCKELDFLRPTMLAAKLECLPIRNSGPSAKIGSLAEADLLAMDRQAATKQWNDALQNLVSQIPYQQYLLIFLFSQRFHLAFCHCRA